MDHWSQGDLTDEVTQQLVQSNSEAKDPTCVCTKKAWVGDMAVFLCMSTDKVQ